MNDLNSGSLRILVLAAGGLAAGVLAGGQAFAESSVSAAPHLEARATEAVIEGKVVGQERPVAKAKVYAYEVASYALEKVRTDGRGRFSFRSLPAGMYKIIAYKEGFVPSIALLLRRKAEESQYLEIQMVDERVGDVRQAEDYWSIRSKLPPDVLRDIQHSWRQDGEDLTPGTTLAGVSRIGGEMLAHGGMQVLGESMGEAHYTGAEVELQGMVGAVQLGLNGHYQLLASETGVGRENVPDAEARSLALALETAGDAKLSVTSSSGQTVNIRDDGVAPVDLEHYQVRYSTPAGRGRSNVTAQYTQEANYHYGGWTDPIDIPEASETWKLEGTYAGELTRRTDLEAGLKYRQRSIDGRYLAGLSGDEGWDPGHEETFGAFGLAESQILPRVVVEYGLFSSVRDGSLSLMPHGGMVVDLGAKWQARTSFARRVDSQDDQDTTYRGFTSAFYGDQTSCRDVGEACYEVFFSRGDSDDDTISVGAVHREYAETLRLYFSPDFFNRLESLFVVQGDELPELQFSMVRRIAPRVLAKLESNLASGGGGIFYATDELPYENQVRYLVTSLDTRFQQTSTGVFVAFHHLEQQLNPTGDNVTDHAVNEVELQRLQLMLTQDLNVLADFASNWAVRLNVELSRGATPFRLTADDELHKKLTGGISVSF